MMYRSLVLSIASLLLITGPVVRAEDQTVVLDDAQIERIRTNCLDVQSTLERVHASDALARVNLGQRYENISTKLMAPLNSRIAFNRLDNVELTKTTVEFNTELNNFRSLYQQYEQTMLRAIQLECRDQPVGFYDTISLARDHRLAVHESVLKLGGLLKQYGVQFEVFKSKVLSPTPAKESTS
jgi:hypothetical protein